MHAHLVNAMWPAYNMNEGITAQYKLCQQHLTKHHVLQASQMPIPTKFVASKERLTGRAGEEGISVSRTDGHSSSQCPQGHHLLCGSLGYLEVAQIALPKPLQHQCVLLGRKGWTSVMKHVERIVSNIINP